MLSLTNCLVVPRFPPTKSKMSKLCEMLEKDFSNLWWLPLVLPLKGVPMRIYSILTIGLVAFFLSSSICFALFGTLDEVISGKEAGSSEAVRLNSSNTGTRRITVQSAGTATIIAKLSTDGQAQLRVAINGQEWLSWKRSSGHDDSPLFVDGRADEKSIFWRSASDPSPKEISISREVQAGDVITMILEGDFGEIGTPLLALKLAGTKGTVEGGSAGTNGSSSSSSGSGSEGEASEGSSLDVEIPFDKSWTIDFQGTVTRTRSSDSSYGRLFTASDRRIELFTLSGHNLYFRVAHRKVCFTSASKGKINNPGGSTDHFAIGSAGVKKGRDVHIVIDYDPSGNVKISLDGRTVIDANFDIKKMPSPVKKMTFPERKANSR